MYIDIHTPYSTDHDRLDLLREIGVLLGEKQALRKKISELKECISAKEDFEEKLRDRIRKMESYIHQGDIIELMKKTPTLDDLNHFIDKATGYKCKIVKDFCWHSHVAIPKEHAFWRNFDVRNAFCVAERINGIKIEDGELWITRHVHGYATTLGHHNLLCRKDCTELAGKLKQLEKEKNND